MNMKLFVASDIHGFFEEFKEALYASGFEKDNPNHMFVGCGDYFDRGRQPFELMKFLMSLDRKVLVRGNHETLFETCCFREEAYMHDITNGTAQTITDIATRNPLGYGYFPEDCSYALARTKAFRNTLVNYFETKNYIFVHSWIPVISKDGKPAYELYGRSFEFNPDWRNATTEEWEAARWGNPFDMATRGLFPDKTIVFGHWHCSEGWNRLLGTPTFGEDSCFKIFDGGNYIGIDACTACTKKVNILVLEDELLEN